MLISMNQKNDYVCGNVTFIHHFSSNDSSDIESVMKNVENKTIIRNIFIKNKLINFITRK